MRLAALRLSQLSHLSFRFSPCVTSSLHLRTMSDEPFPKRLRPDPSLSSSSSSTLPPSTSHPSASTLTAPITPDLPSDRRKHKPPHPHRVQHPKKTKVYRPSKPEPYSAGDVLWQDVQDVLGREYVTSLLSRTSGSREAEEDQYIPPSGLEYLSVVEVTIAALSVGGDGLAVVEKEGKRWALVVPFTHPGDKVKVKVFKNDRLHSHADMVEMLERDGRLRGGEGDREVYPEKGCKYFGECGGCQLQPVPYPLQLAHKLRTLQLAYNRFSLLPSSLVPEVLPTIGSPKQWGYRTKITPHFDAPPKWAQAAVGRKTGRHAGKPKAAGKGVGEEEMQNGTAEGVDTTPGGEVIERGGEGRNWQVRIGFERKGKPGVLDIEECPIATPVLNARLTEERPRVQSSIMSFTKGATLLLRDSLPAPAVTVSSDHPFDPSTAYPVITGDDAPVDASADGDDRLHVAITSHKDDVYERVGGFLFAFSAGNFFQNNNSILLPLTEYVRDAIFPSTTGGSTSFPAISGDIVPVAAGAAALPTHLVDTYCGSGLFGITLSPYFTRVAGVEISPESIVAAKRNAEMNGLQEKSTWLCGKAEDIFGDLPGAGFAGGHSCVVIDPPRKGCDTPFLEQLLAFRPVTIVYVSCNVHTQARDVGWLVRESAKRGANEASAGSAAGTAGTVTEVDVDAEQALEPKENGENGRKGWKYVLESLRGFDLFPQTAHVEGVAVLRLVYV